MNFPPPHLIFDEAIIILHSLIISYHRVGSTYYNEIEPHADSRLVYHTIFGAYRRLNSEGIMKTIGAGR